MKMDQNLKSSKYQSYDKESVPQAEIYTQPGVAWQGVAVNGIPLYPDETPGNPRLGRFVVQGCQDLWAAVLFLVTLTMVVIWGVVNMTMRSELLVDNSTGNSLPGNEEKIVKADFILVFLVFFISVAGASGSLIMMNLFPRKIIFIANMLTVVLLLIAAVLFFITGVVFGGIIMLLLCVLQGIWLYCVRDRIAFSAELLRAASDILMRYKAIFVFNFALGVVSMIYMFFWCAMTFPAVESVNGPNGYWGDGLFIIFALLLVFWVMQVMPNIMHVTTAGVTATWYFSGEGRMPKNPTLASFTRATTTSLGSICFGSLIVAVIRLLRWLAESATNNENAFIRCIVSCFFSCLEQMMEYFNTYAFVHIAVYGCSYIEAAKRTWQLCKQCFFAAYFNDALISSTLGLLSISVSAVIGVAAGLIYKSVVAGVLACFISLLVHFLFFSAVESAVTTLFVCFAEVPEGLQHSSPELYAALRNADQNGTSNNAAP